MKQYIVYYIWKDLDTGKTRETVSDYPKYEIGDRFGNWVVIDYAEELSDDEEEM